MGSHAEEGKAREHEKENSDDSFRCAVLPTQCEEQKTVSLIIEFVKGIQVSPILFEYAQFEIEVYLNCSQNDTPLSYVLNGLLNLKFTEFKRFLPGYHFFKQSGKYPRIYRKPD